MTAGCLWWVIWRKPEGGPPQPRSQWPQLSPHSVGQAASASACPPPRRQPLLRFQPMAVAGSSSDGTLASPAGDQTGRGGSPHDGGPEQRSALVDPAFTATSTADGNRAVSSGAEATLTDAFARGGGSSLDAADTRRGSGPYSSAPSPPQPSPPGGTSRASSFTSRSASPAPVHTTMFSPSASARATAAAVTEQRLQQLIRERAGLEPHRSRWPATWALLEGEVARLCRLANAAGVAAAVAAGSAPGSVPLSGGDFSAAGGTVSCAQLPAVGDPLSAPARAERTSPAADARGLVAGGGIAGIPQDMQEVQAAGPVAAGRASPSAQLMGRRWAPETPLSHVSSPTGLSVQGGHGGEKQLPQLTVSAYGGGRGDGGGAAYGLTPAAGVAASTPVPVGPVPSGTKQSVRLLVPAEKYPDFNFVGRILGPRGATLKALERETSCKIMIRGRGSIRRDKEAEVRGKPGWAHCFSDPLHVIIEADAADEAAATRALNRAKEAVELLLVPVAEEVDTLKRQQLRDLAIINGACRAADAAAAAAAAAAVGKSGEAATGGGPSLAHLPDNSPATAPPPAWTPPAPGTPVFSGRYSEGSSGTRSMAPRGAYPSDIPQPGMLGCQTSYGGASGLLGAPYGGHHTTSAVAAAPPLMSPLPLVSPLSTTPSGGGDGGAAWSFAESISNISLDGGSAEVASGGSGGGGGVGVGGGRGGVVTFGEMGDQRHLDLQFEVRPDARRPSPDTPVTAPSIKTLVASTGGTPVPVSTGVGSGGFMSQDFYGGAFSDYGRSAEARGWSSPTEVLSAPAPQTDNQDGQPAA